MSTTEIHSTPVEEGSTGECWKEEKGHGEHSAQQVKNLAKFFGYLGVVL
jgi:hypothetical protein